MRALRSFLAGLVSSLVLASPLPCAAAEGVSGTHIGAVALPVDSLIRATAFYASVFGMVVTRSYDNASMTENIMGFEGGSGASLVLVEYKDKVPDKSESVRVVFYAPDPASSLAAGVELGASVVVPAREIPSLGATLGIMRDPDGYLVEVIQPSASH